MVRRKVVSIYTCTVAVMKSGMAIAVPTVQVPPTLVINVIDTHKS